MQALTPNTNSNMIIVMKNNYMNKKIKYRFMIGGILLFFLSIFMAFQASILYENLTYVGTIKNNHTFFVVWGILLSLYYTYGYYLFMKINTVFNKKYFYICIGICILSILSFLSPYTLHSGDFLSQFHVFGSMSSCTLSFILFGYTLIQIQFQDMNYYIKIEKSIFTVLFMALIPLIVVGDICTLSEIIILNGLIFIMNYALHLKYEKNEI